MCRETDGPWVPDPNEIYAQKKKKKKNELAATGLPLLPSYLV